MSATDRCQCGHYRGNHDPGCRVCECTGFTEPFEPELPYAGTSGWSGSDTSRERAERDDSSGTTTRRQNEALTWLRFRDVSGSTWKELASHYGWHHGQASGVLSVLHMTGKIARLTERRDRCAIYVLPEHVGEREVAAHGRQTTGLSDEERAALEWAEHQLTLPWPSREWDDRQLRVLCEALRRYE